MLIKQLIPGFYFWDGERRISSEPKIKMKKKNCQSLLEVLCLSVMFKLRKSARLDKIANFQNQAQRKHSKTNHYDFKLESLLNLTNNWEIHLASFSAWL